MNPRRAQMIGEYNRFMGLGDTTPSMIDTSTPAPKITSAVTESVVATVETLDKVDQYFIQNPNMKYVAGAALLAIVYFLWPRR
jgi:hypothetical protein